MSSNNRLAAFVGVAAALAWAVPALAAEDLAALQVQGQRGQSAEQVRRDRYECHNWAVEQSGETPVAAPVVDEQPSDAERSRRAERIDRAITGAAIGAGLGGLVRATQHDDPSHGVLAGAAVGAAIGAATAGKSRERDAEEAVEEPSDYLRALTACLEGRGYSVSLPSSAELTANR
jgi:hypothetical protein